MRAPLRFFVSVILMMVAALVVAPAAWADTNVSGAINLDTTWNLAGSPYIMGADVTVQPGITLTIEPGVVVRGTNASSNDVELFVNGTLRAVGTQAQPITFEGTTNTTSGFWEGLTVAAGAVVVLDHVAINNADTAIEVASGVSTLTLSNLSIDYFARFGINHLGLPGTLRVNGLLANGRGNAGAFGVRAVGSGASGLVVVENGNIQRSNTGVSTTNASITLDHTIITDASGAVESAASTVGSWTVNITNCTFYENVDVIRTTRSFSSYNLTVLVSDSIFQANTTLVRSTNSSYPTVLSSFERNIYQGGTVLSGISQTISASNLNYVALMVDPENRNFAPTNRSPARYYSPDNPANVAGAVPFGGADTGAGYHGFYYEDFVFVRDQTYDVIGDMIIAPGTEIQFDINSTFRMATTDIMAGGTDPARVEIRVEGRFTSDGTLTRPVRFTSARTTPVRGDWYGIIVPSNAELSSIAQLDIGWARQGLSIFNRNVTLADSKIHDCSVYGIFVDAGSPTFVSNELYGNTNALYATNNASVSWTDTTVRTSTSTAIVLLNASLDWTGGIAYDNLSTVISASSTNVGSRTVYVDGVTIVDNAGAAIETSRSFSSYNLSLILVDTNITNNTGAGLRDLNTSYPVSFSCANSNVWSNSPNYSSISTSSPTCVSWNPIYADRDANNYAPTRFSPLRELGSTGGVIGGVAYGGAIGPQYMGFLWDDITFTAAGSPYQILGDLYVPSGTRVTIEPGVIFRVVSNADAMAGGTSTTRTELRFLSGALYTFPTTGDPIVFTPATSSPPVNAWIGARFDDNTGSVGKIRIEYASIGIDVDGPRSPSFTDVETRYCSSGVTVDGVTNATNFADFLALSVIGLGSGTGIAANNSITRVRSSFITHHSTGMSFNASIVGSFSARLINNSIINQATGISLSRSFSSYNLSATIQNNLIANSTSRAIQDGNSSYPTTVSLANNGYFNVTTITGITSLGSGHVTGNPLVEDDDWNPRPRWWDPQVWRTAPVLNVGLASASELPTRDLYGRNRVLSTRVDIGAVEHDFTANQEPRADAVSTTLNPSGASLIAPTGEPVTYSGAASVDLDGTIANAFWTFSDGTVTAGQTVQHTFNTRGANQEAYITIVDDDGAEDHARVIVNVNDRPIAEANGPYRVDAGGELARFRADGSNDPEGGSLSYSWNFGNGNTGTGANPTQAYASAGFYIATLTVTDNVGLTQTDTAIVEVLGVADNQGPLVQHVPPANGQPSGVAVPIEVTAQDATGIASITMFYRPIGTIPADELNLSLITGTRWGASLPAPAVQGPGLEYWFVAVDTAAAGNSSRTPSTGTYSFTVSGDLTPPVIQHTEIADGRPAASAVTVTATVTDTAGVGTVNLYYGTLAGTFTVTPMSNVTGNTWSAQIPAFIVNAPGVKYYIEARDQSPVPNRAVLPANAPTGFFDFTVASGDTTPPTIVVTPVANNRPTGTAVPVTANIVDSGGTITGAALFYRTGSTGGYSSVTMTNTSGSTWTGSIPSAAVATPLVQYYVTATDGASNTGTEPAGAPGAPLQFTVVAADSTPPTITHTPVPNGQPVGVAVNVTATVTDASAITYVRLHYKRSTSSAAPPWPYVEMTNTSGSTWTAQIPDFAVGAPSVVYYIRALDAAGNTALLPTGSTDSPYSFSVGAADTAPPTITHTPITSAIGGQDITFIAGITDAGTITSASVFWSADGGAWTERAMTLAGGSNWSTSLPFASLPAGVGSLRYYFRASDNSSNVAFLPASGITAPYSFNFVYPDTTGPTTTIDAIPGPLTAGQPVTVTIRATDISGVDNVTLYVRSTTSGPYTAFTASGTGPYTVNVAGTFVQVPRLQLYAVTSDSLDNETTTTLIEVVVNAPTDLTAPTITSTAITNGQLEGVAVPVTANVTDATGIASVTLFYRVQGAPSFTNIAMSSTGGGNYGASIPSGSVTIAGVDYYIRAIDSAPASNTAVLPTTAPGTPSRFTVVSSDTTGPTLSHTAPTGPFIAGDNIPLAVSASDPSGVSTVELLWRNASSGAFTTVNMTNTAGTWSATITPANAPTVNYYFRATDSRGNVSVFPTGAPTTTASLTITPRDTTAPTITSTAIANGQLEGVAVPVAASVTDATGIASVTLFYRVQGAPSFSNIAMSSTGGSNYGASIPAGSVTTAGVEYYIRAIDSASAGNTAVLPTTAPGTPFRFTVVSSDLTGPTLAHTPPGGPFIAGDNIPLAVSASDPSGVSAVQLLWRNASSGAFTTVNMTNTAGTWSTTITPANAPIVNYYFRATDGLGNVSVSPVGAPTTTTSLVITPRDTTAPAITHTPIVGPVSPGAAQAIVATVTDASGINRVELRYRTTGAATYTLVNMTPGGDNSWSAVIPGGTVAVPGVQYYITAVDNFVTPNSAVAPTTAPGTPYSFAVGTIVSDTTPPTVTHTVPSAAANANQALTLTAQASDASGIASMTLWFRVSGDPSFISQPMTLSGGSWTATIAGRNVDLPAVEYYFVGVDASSNANSGTSPTGAPTSFHTLNVIVPDTTAPTITIGSLPTSVDQNTPVEVTATITDASGVAQARVLVVGSTGTIAIPMTNSSGSTWRATISADLVIAGTLRFYIDAADTAPATNVAVAPAGAPTSTYEITVVDPDLDVTGPTITGTIASPQPADLALNVAFGATDDNGVISVTLYARHTDDAWTAIPLTFSSGQWRGTIPAATMRTGTVQWYVEATDGFNNLSTLPVAGESAPSSFTVEGETIDDTTAPTIAHTARESYSLNEDAIFEATVTDASGIALVTLYYRFEGDTDFLSIDATPSVGSADVWEAIIPSDELLEGTLSYYWTAVDLSDLGNLASLPDTAPAALFSVAIVDPAAGDNDSDAGSDAGPDADSDAGADADSDATDSDVDGSDAGDDSGTADGDSDAGPDDDTTTNPDGDSSDAGDDSGSPDSSTDGNTADLSLPDLSTDGSGTLTDVDDDGSISSGASGGGCSSAPASTTGFAWLLAALVLPLVRRRRRG
jgi:MYXO-CTERM domain-containing protein